MSDRDERMVPVPLDLLACWLAALESLAPEGGPGDSQEITYRDIGEMIGNAIGWFDRARAILDEAEGIAAY